MLTKPDSYLPYTATILENRTESADIFTLRLEVDYKGKSSFDSFMSGQFNMLYLFGVGEVAISILDMEICENSVIFEHTIQVVGRVTAGLSRLKIGDNIGLRGPFGSSWPLDQAIGHDIVIMTGGLGNAPLVHAMKVITQNRARYGMVYVIHGIKDSKSLIYREKYEFWNMLPNTSVQIAAGSGDFFGPWQWHRGLVTSAIRCLDINKQNTIVMSVGPEIMMKAVAVNFVEYGVEPNNIYLSLERNMKCAIGHCGHCQLGSQFICKDGPVYPYSRISKLLEIEGL